MNIEKALESLLDHKHVIRRASWRNNRKALYISRKGALSVIYETRQGLMADACYVPYKADIKANDWVIIPIKSTGDHILNIQDALKDRDNKRHKTFHAVAKRTL